MTQLYSTRDWGLSAGECMQVSADLSSWRTCTCSNGAGD